ncbi:MAG TPA: LytTR family DNA-binding domain-containing protein [Bacteroidales bacterium]|nr:LytTR family DNA-binding domain-containing protein [Bacteroidales bacterium]
MGIINYLKQPFPKAENKWKIIIFISLFVAAFLIIFQPFNINLYKGNNKLIVLSGYGLITFFILVFDMIVLENIFKKFYNDQNWKIWKEFVALTWVIFSIGLGNAIYTSIVFDFYFEVGIRFYINFQLITIVVGIIPITVLIVSKQKYLSTKYSYSANNLNRKLEKEKTASSVNQQIKIFGDNQKDFIEFDLNDFLFIESSGNYIEVHYLENNKDIRKTLRNTIKNSLNFFQDITEVLQCHRAFIVNTNKIINAKGNSQGLILHLENCDYEVPVSRNYVERFRNQIG